MHKLRVEFLERSCNKPLSSRTHILLEHQCNRSFTNLYQSISRQQYVPHLTFHINNCSKFDSNQPVHLNGLLKKRNGISSGRSACCVVLKKIIVNRQYLHMYVLILIPRCLRLE